MVVISSILKTATFATYFVSSPLLFTFTCNRKNYETNNDQICFEHKDTKEEMNSKLMLYGEHNRLFNKLGKGSSQSH